MEVMFALFQTTAESLLMQGRVVQASLDTTTTTPQDPAGSSHMVAVWEMRTTLHRWSRVASFVLTWLVSRLALSGQMQQLVSSNKVHLVSTLHAPAFMEHC